MASMNQINAAGRARMRFHRAALAQQAGKPHCSSLPAPEPLLRRPHRRILPAAASADWPGGSAGRETGAGGGGAAGERPAAAATEAGSQEREEILKLVSLLPPKLSERLQQHPELMALVEVVMDLGRPPLARFGGEARDVRLGEAAVAPEDLQYAMGQVGDFGGDNRAGIDKTLHRVSCIRNRAGRVVGLTCRVGRAISGSADMVADLARAGKSILLLGRPGVGKTTAIREISRLLADECQQRVVIVDTSNEIGGDGDIPHPGIGRARRMQVPQPEQQHRVMVEAVENHFPQCIIIDEIGTEAECLAARTIAQRGVQLVATAHGNELENVMKNPSLSDLVGGICSVTLGDEEAKRRGVQKSVLERQSPPTFDVCVEMVSREQWRVHLDVGWAVDALLVGKEAGAEVRERDEKGKVWCWPEGGSTDFEDEDEEEEGAASGEGAAAARRSGQQRRRTSRQAMDTQPFPADALAAARRGAEQMSGRAAALRGDSAAAAAPSTAKPSNAGGSKPGGNKSGGSGSGGESSTALHVYPYGLDGAAIADVAESLGLGGGLVVAQRIQDADTVLALRGKINSSSWIREASKSAGIPVYSVKTASISNLVRAVRTLLGVDPSPGAMFSDDVESPAAADPRARTSNSRTLRAETSIALAAAAGASGGSARAAERDALEEARLAAEQIVIPRCQPVELLPREPPVVELQVQLVESLGLPFEVVGAAASLRLRILPPAWAGSGTTSGGSSSPPPPAAGSDAAAVAAAAAAAAAVKGAKQKQYW